MYSKILVFTKAAFNRIILRTDFNLLKNKVRRKYMKRKIFAILLILALSLSLAACGGSQTPAPGSSSPSASSTPAGKPVEITVAFSVLPNGLEPIVEDLSTTLSVTCLIFDKLVELDEKLEMIPGVAKTWKQLDELTWEFEINLDHKFHNGDQLTMEDVVYSFERLHDFTRSADVAVMIDSVTYTGNILTLKTKQPNNTTVPRLLWTTIIVNKKYLESGGDDALYTKVIGTGPYKVVDFIPGQSVVLEAWAEHALGKPQVDKISFVAIPENGNRYIAVESGQVQYAGLISTYEFELAKEKGTFNLLEAQSNRNYNITFNTERAPFDNVNVRKALSFALNQDSFAALEGGRPKITSILFASFPAYYRESRNQPGFDLDKAKQLLEAEGYNASNPLKCSILTWLNDPGIELFQSDLRKIGVELSIDFREFSVYIAEEGGGNFDMVFGANKNIAGTALMDLERLDTGFKGTRNISRYSNPRVDELIARARVTADAKELADITDELNDIVAEDCPVFPICVMTMYSVLDKNLTGVYNRADQTQVLRYAVYNG